MSVERAVIYHRTRHVVSLGLGVACAENAEMCERGKKCRKAPGSWESLIKIQFSLLAPTRLTAGDDRTVAMRDRDRQCWFLLP